MGISPFSVGKPSINGPSRPFYTIAMLVYQRVTSMGISQFLWLQTETPQWRPWTICEQRRLRCIGRLCGSPVGLRLGIHGNSGGNPCRVYDINCEWNGTCEMFEADSLKRIYVYTYIYMLAPLEIHFWSCLQWVWACIIGIEHKYIKLTNSRFKKISSKKENCGIKKIAAKSKFAIGMFSARIIDKISIRHATILAYCNAIQQLQLSK